MIVLIFVAKYYKSVINTAVIHLWLKSGLENLRFTVASKNIGKGWSKRLSQGNFVDLVMHDVIDAKLDKRSSNLHNSTKICLEKDADGGFRTAVQI